MKDFLRKNYSRILFGTGVLLFCSELWKQFAINCVLNVCDGYCWWYFPLQLCSTPMYVCLLLRITEKGDRNSLSADSCGPFPARLRDSLLTYLACFGLLAGAFAFFDTSGFTELGYLPLSVHSWVWHLLLILMGLLVFACSTEFVPDFPGALGLYLSGCLAAELINAIGGNFGTINMFYINPRYRMAQAYFAQIADYAGNGAGILCYIMATILGAVILYILLLLCRQVLSSVSARSL